MGELSKRGDADLLLAVIKTAEEFLERAPRATVKGMAPVERPPANVETQSKRNE